MDQLLERVIDIHAHCGPDSIERSIDAVELAKIARAHGMRGLVLKNHFEPTASAAYFVRREVPHIDVFGGITLNLATGGMNPRAVEHMAAVTGGWGRFVWMGSVDTEAHVRHNQQHHRPFVAVSRDGRLLDQVQRVISVAAEHDLVLATGHCAAEETLLMVREALRRGIQHIVITHAMMAPIHMSVEQMREAAGLGAMIEFVYNGLIGPHKEFEPVDYANAIRAIGPSHCILASDMGQTVNPVHPTGLVTFFKVLSEAGINADELDLMSKTNPAKLLGLDRC